MLTIVIAIFLDESFGSYSIVVRWRMPGAGNISWYCTRSLIQQFKNQISITFDYLLFDKHLSKMAFFDMCFYMSTLIIKQRNIDRIYKEIISF